MRGQGNVLVLHTGGLGDLVLFSGFLASVRHAWPETRVTLGCLNHLTGLARLMPTPPQRTVGIPFNPYLHDAPAPELDDDLGRLVRQLRRQPPELVVLASHRASWLDWFLAAALRPLHACGVSPELPPRGLLTCLRNAHGLNLPSIQPTRSEAYSHEILRYGAILQLLGLESAPMTPWTLPAGADSETRQYLAAAGLQPDQYLACFPTGAIPEKRWPKERFVEVVRAVQAEFGLDVLLLGSATHEKALAEFLPALPGAHVYAGSPGDLPLLAGLLSHCRAWLGNDTGPAHLAQAYLRPGVAVFSEGVNHIFAPWAPGAIGLFHPLPCSGCFWDCAFGHGVCIESIPVDGVLRALRDALTSPPETPEIRKFDLIDPAMARLMGEASARYVESQRDRRQRFDLLVELGCDTRCMNANDAPGRSFWRRLSRW